MGEEEVLFVRKATGLVRTAGWLATCSLTFMYLTSGIPMYPFQALDWWPGSNIPLTYIIGFLVMFWPSFTIILFTMAMPRTSSDYVAVSRALNPMLGFLGTAIQWQNLIWVQGAILVFSVWYFGAGFHLMGAIMNNAGLLNLGTALTEYGNPMVVALSIIMVIVFGLILLIGTRWAAKLGNALFLISLVGVFMGIGASVHTALTGGPAVAKGIWDTAFGAGAWQEVIDVAETNGWSGYVAAASGSSEVWGWPGQWSLLQTLPATLPATWAIWGWEIMNYAAGEIKNPKKEYPLGIFVSFFLTIFWYLSCVTALWLSYGKFLSYYSYVTMEGFRDQLVINPGSEPSLFFFTAALYGYNPLLAGLCIMTQNMIMLGGSLTMLVVVSRIQFAFAYDRVFPEFFARVNDRFHTPHWSIMVIMILSILFVIVTCWFPYLAAFNVYASAGLRYLFASWAGIVFPYTRPELFERSIPWRFAGIPIITWCGIIGTITSTWLFITAMTEIADVGSLFYQIAIIAGFIILFGAYYAYNMKKGVDMGALYREIPPA